jgi:chromosome segregation protein
VRLTALTLHGFKSFGDRTTLEFAPGVTAIIGPNGSGKSNVIEALRWTSGGGRASEFRAGDKADLIFHGALGKRALGYAEVELEIKGLSRHIHIARSLYRDGQSKLRLNGRTARFLDIEDELSGSGLGRGGLALIGQGEVSQVLMADPPKLLDYVAEAAGVAKLSTRREQTHTRLQTTREHLVRLEDIMRELRRHIGQLAQEAQQAERVGALEREALRLRYTLSRRRVESVQQEVAGLTQERALLEDAVTEGREALDGAREAWNASRQHLAEQEVQYRQAMAQAEARRGDLRVAQERLRNLQDRYDRTQQEQDTLRTDIARLEGAVPPTAPEGDTAHLQAAV